MEKTAVSKIRKLANNLLPADYLKAAFLFEVIGEGLC